MQLVVAQRLHDSLSLRCRCKEVGGGADDVTDISPKRNIVVDLLLRWADAHMRQLLPSVVTTESGKGMDRVKRVYGYAMNAGVIVRGAFDLSHT